MAKHVATDSPATTSGQHAAGPAHRSRRAERADEARRRKRSIAVSATIALVGSIVGFGMMAVTGYPVSTHAGGGDAETQTASESSAGTADDAALETQDAELTEEFLEQKAIDERQAPLESGAPEGSPEAALDGFGAYSVTKDDIAGLPADADAFAFNLDGEDASPASLSEKSAQAIAGAVKAIRDEGAQASFILLDLQTGRGIACDLDAQPYGASSFKGLFVAYLCEGADAGDLDIDGMEGTIESTIAYSDNDAYDWLRQSYSGDGLQTWLEANGVSGDEQLYRDWYPFQSARQSSTLWLHVDDYLASGSDNAQWLSGLYGQTNVSFIRDGIGDDGVQVRNKAGWYAAEYGDDPAWNGTCDAGLVDCNGHTYLMSVMTGLPTSDEATQKAEALVNAIWQARADLGLQAGGADGEATAAEAMPAGGSGKASEAAA